MQNKHNNEKQTKKYFWRGLAVVFCVLVFSFSGGQNIKALEKATVTPEPEYVMPSAAQEQELREGIQKGYFTGAQGEAALNSIVTSNPILKSIAEEELKKMERKAKWDKFWAKLVETVKKNGSAAWHATLYNALQALAIDAANYLAVGGQGQKPLFFTEGFGGFLSNTADNAVGYFVEELGKDPKTSSISKFICNPDFNVKLRIGLGLVEYSKPTAPTCTFKTISANWDQAIQSANFLNDFQDVFEPTSNDAGISLTLMSNALEMRDEAVKIGELDRQEGEGYKRNQTLSGNYSDTPKATQNSETSLNEGISKLMGATTQDPWVDAAKVFVNTWALKSWQNLMKNLAANQVNEKYNINPAWLSNKSADPAVSSDIASSRIKNILGPKVNVRGDYDVLSELVTCLDPTKAGPTNCVITDKFMQAIEQKKTVREALDDGYLQGSGIFGFSAGGDEPKYNDNNYPYRSMIILRKFRIIPVGWEIAAQYIKEKNPRGAGGGNITLSDMISCFSDSDEFKGYDATWCHGLVDPDWVLKAPLGYCAREGYGPELLSDEITSSELSISRKDNYCADEQSCIKEKSDGSCEIYGYCTEERRSWNMSAETCQPNYNTCQTYRKESGETVSYLKNTLEFCSAENAGCLGYCTSFDYASGKFLCTATSTDNKIYLNKNVAECDASQEGCHEFIRTKEGTGANLVSNSGFEDSDLSFWNVASATDITNNISTSESYEGSNSLNISSSLYFNIPVGPNGYSVGGGTYTASFYAKGCDKASFGGIEDERISSTDWQGFSLNYTYPATTAGNKVLLSINGGANCYIDAIKIENGFGTDYSNYRAEGLVYEKLLPAYLEGACYISDTDHRLKDNAPTVCQNFARKCNRDEAGCELFTSKDEGWKVPAKVNASSYCADECVGYDMYMQNPSSVEANSLDKYFIPKTAKTCSAQSAGCDEYTNLDKVAAGGEGREYFSYLRQCVKPDSGECGEYYYWQGSGESGYQLKVISLKSADNGAPFVNANGDCSEEIYNKTSDEAGYNPDCREFYDKSGNKYYKLYSKTVSCTADCHSYRRSEDNNIYSVAPSESQTCGAQDNGCREYSGNQGNTTRLVLNSDFESGTNEGWIGSGSAVVAVSTDSLFATEHSLEVSGGNHVVSLDASAYIKIGNDYKISFLAKTKSGSASLKLTAGDSSSNFNILADWKMYSYNFTAQDDIVAFQFTNNSDFYIDDIRLTETSERYYLIKDSWNTPASCDQPSLHYALGCAEYTDRDNRSNYLRSQGLSDLCQESAAGCEILIDTKNSSVYDDEFIYAVYDRDKLCESENKGCQMFGSPYTYDNQTVYSQKFLKNNPDTYDTILCSKEGEGCADWGGTYFKDPGDTACEWRQGKGSLSSWNWYKKAVKKCSTGGQVCLQDSDCSQGTCVLDTADHPCDTTSTKTIGYGGSGNIVAQPATGWAGICSADASGCTEFIDPKSEYSPNLVFNSSFATISTTDHAGWSNQGEQEVKIEPFTLYTLSASSAEPITSISCLADIYSLNSDNTLTVAPNKTISLNSNGLALFYSGDNNKCKISGGKAGKIIELKKSIIEYRLNTNIDYASCNGTVDSKKGCVLFNERTQNGTALSALTYNAYAVGANSNSPVACKDGEGCNANKIIKVEPDRVCAKWLACRSKAIVKNENNEEQAVCFDVGVCESFDATGQCNGFVVGEKTTDQNGNLVNKVQNFNFTDSDNTEKEKYSLTSNIYNNLSGYSKVGTTFTSLLNNIYTTKSASDYTMRANYSLGEMKEVGEMAEVSNGDFELYGNNGYPVGWTPQGSNSQGASWSADKFEVIDNPIYAQEFANIRYPLEGKSFLKYSAADSNYFPLSGQIAVTPDTDYVISFYINTLDLSSASAKITINGGVSVSEVKESAGVDWKMKVVSFKTNSNTSKISILLGADNGASGSIYVDDIKIRPALETQPGWSNTQSCRLYPEEDSLSCDYYDDSGAREKGWLGYCLEYDRYPGSSNACLMWWPTDKVKGDGIEEGAGYTGKFPLYYTLEGKATPVYEYRHAYYLGRTSDGCSRFTCNLGYNKLITYYRYHSGGIFSSNSDPCDCICVPDNSDVAILDGLADNYPEDAYSHNPNKSYKESWGSDIASNKYPVSKFDGWYPYNGQDSFGPTGAYIGKNESENDNFSDFENKYASYLCDGQTSCILNKELVRSNIYASKIAQVVTPTGVNKYWSGRVYDGSPYKLPTSKIGYAQDSSPFGAITTLAPSSNPYEWDTIVDNTANINSLGNQPMYFVQSPAFGEPRSGWIGFCASGDVACSSIIDPAGPVPYKKTSYSTTNSSIDLAKDDIKGIFAESYGLWNWSSESICYGGVKEGQKCANTVECQGTCPGLSNKKCNIEKTTKEDATEGHCQNNNAVCNSENDCETYCSLDYSDIGCMEEAHYQCLQTTVVKDVITKYCSNSQATSCIQDSDCYFDCPADFDYQARCDNTGATGHYVMDSSNLNWTVPSVKCDSKAASRDYCYNDPKIQNIKISDTDINRSAFIRLDFNSIVDEQQKPLVAYEVNWGDGEKTTVSGAEMRDRPNPENPHSLYHLYDYWDVKSKQTCDGGVCTITPSIKITDNWGKSASANGSSIKVREK